ncbi:MAG: DUF3795 domain-containing protein [Dehalococcoidales bacterium]|nr:DUF3795 domain-containing protein [Dehalococcoidales bacterium]
MEEILIAPCGMNCGVCGNYLAMKNDLKKNGVYKSYCPGCRPRGKNCAFMKKNCELVGEGKVQFCFECPDFPCLRLKHLDKRYSTKYHMSMIENLNFIKENGMEKFLEKETKKWQCPECGGVISCHHGVCFTCDVDNIHNREKIKSWTGV